MSDLVLNRHNPFLSRPTKGEESTDLTADEAVEHFIRESLSENTRKAYRSDLAHFSGWGGELPATADLVARYLADHADMLASSSLARRIATLSKVHEANGWPNPCRSEVVRATMRGIKRVKGTAQDQARPLLREDLFILLDALGDDVRGKRDRALLLIGWAGGFRSSELVGLDLADIEEVREGLVLHLRRSKTDQTGTGRKIGIPLGRTRHCPVAALSAWLDALRVNDGPIFRPVDRHDNVQPDRLRSDAVSTILRERLARAGINSEGYSGHSLRAGLATSAIKAGVPTYKVRAQTGHASDLMLSRYVRDAGLFDGNAAGALL
ncbi:Tyrosine recombinase XerD [Aliiroseovarius sp. xm-m-379]|uniref:site-specific integrase n=1 Tax=unclassified Aliiroseovarius TaxID=2623558 RepID=UPI0015684653|nr:MULTISPECIES: site-specific integrase [unclassified Aliiroseovarius]NRP13981.1 Tyrosine recombinase XerD [Aliiroseovarius sp. xm-d-517]NRP23354.1 Tyrosine recombinase XerD [Aliiroseovarius sp. xm-m-379]NRP32153.1 Tyrosine recombinase XerD [Aliiroseovarius sp. xm-a-104]NRP41868.1 Tyrosine recombinase XerD [Aliiroseovarius sp. xm-m-339-2]NRP48574.1 Tyrosine recombinase XerD [Aliiroseovarius sp. xm-m-354]